MKKLTTTTALPGRTELPLERRRLRRQEQAKVRAIRRAVLKGATVTYRVGKQKKRKDQGSATEQGEK